MVWWSTSAAAVACPGSSSPTPVPTSQVLLVDRRAARTDHLVRLVRGLGLESRVTVRCADALTLTLDTPPAAVVARGFGAPELTARAAARLLADDGMLVVSEPPEQRRRPLACGVVVPTAPVARSAGRRPASCSTWNIDWT